MSERNKYIENINALMKKQESKGLSTYGKLLQDNTGMTTVERIEYLEEELVDALMYMEHLKENIESVWIPIEKPPLKFNCCYLITDINGVVSEAMYTGPNSWVDPYEEYYVFTPIAWRQLPEAYKGGLSDV